jgi:3-dehydroquinate synthase
MVYAAAVAAMVGVGPDEMVDAHREALQAVGLPTSIDGLQWRKVRERMVMDKKYAKGDRLVLLEELGKPVVREVPPDVLERAWEVVSG